MELEFDKEIDAILRKARHTGSAAAASPHLDADVIAAFAENAVPRGARVQYTTHLADCGRCRKYLSETIRAGEGATGKSAMPAAALSPAGPSVPWYQAIFKTPNLAVAMGTLILVFTGILGFLVIRNDRGEQNAIVTQVSEPEFRQGGPFVDDQTMMTANTNAAVLDTVGAASNTTVNTATAANPAANTAVGAGSDLRKNVVRERPGDADGTIAAAGELAELQKSPAAPPPPPAAAVSRTELMAADQDDTKKDDAERRQAERSDASLALKRKEAETARTRDVAPAARSGPVQTQSNQIAGNAVQMTVTRSVGGRKFTNRDGAWYDTAYRGQATTNIRRGTDEFRKLDSGLRKIADQIDGVVVVMWKSRAYRIQ